MTAGLSKSIYAIKIRAKFHHLAELIKQIQRRYLRAKIRIFEPYGYEAAELVPARELHTNKNFGIMLGYHLGLRVSAALYAATSKRCSSQVRTLRNSAQRDSYIDAWHLTPHDLQSGTERRFGSHTAI